MCASVLYKHGIQQIKVILQELQMYMEKMQFKNIEAFKGCLLYTSDAADERSSVDLGGRRIIKKKKNVDIVGGGKIDVITTA